VKSIVSDLGYSDAVVKLGYVENVSTHTFEELDKRLKEEGFERLVSNNEIICEKVKLVLIDLITNSNLDELSMNISDYISVKIGMPYTTAATHFKKTCNHSIDSYWQALRMEKAKEWLSYEDHTVTEITQKVGYNSLQSFTKAFKLDVGLRPSIFQRQKNFNIKYSLKICSSGDCNSNASVKKIAINPTVVWNQYGNK
jgi:AraC-like DNA-binding protein